LHRRPPRLAVEAKRNRLSAKTTRTEASVVFTAFVRTHMHASHRHTAQRGEASSPNVETRAKVQIFPEIAELHKERDDEPLEWPLECASMQSLTSRPLDKQYNESPSTEKKEEDRTVSVWVCVDVRMT
jgi:hypothetical protein